MDNYFDFLKEDIKKGLLKNECVIENNKRVGMKRRTLKYLNGRNVEELVYLPLIKDFVVLKFGGFE